MAARWLSDAAQKLRRAVLLGQAARPAAARLPFPASPVAVKLRAPMVFPNSANGGELNS